MSLGRAEWIIAHNSKDMFLVLRSIQPQLRVCKLKDDKLHESANTKQDICEHGVNTG